MSRRGFAGLLLVVPMVLFGGGVYLGLGTFKTNAFAPATTPVTTKARVILPGTIFVTQDGVLYRLRKGSFARLDSGGWMQPAVTPDGNHLVAVLRTGFYSDLYLLDFDGHVQRQLTHNSAIFFAHNHWSFYPHFSADGGTVFYSYDPKDPSNGYRVDLAVYGQPVNPPGPPKQWTNPNPYTGGDVQPVPLAGGGFVYSRYAIGADGQNYSQIWFQPTPLAAGTPLTAPAQDCSEPALSPNENWLAFICTSNSQVATLMLAPFRRDRLGAAVALVSGDMCASPTWSPAGTGLAYLAPVGAAGHFQLFYLGLPELGAGVVPGTHPRPVEVTSDVDLDAISPPAWA